MTARNLQLSRQIYLKSISLVLKMKIRLSLRELMLQRTLTTVMKLHSLRQHIIISAHLHQSH